VSPEHPRELYHDVKWTPAAVRRFWDFQGANAASEQGYFARRFGPRVVRLAARCGALSGPVGDLGCGPGFLSAALLERGLTVHAVDSSERAVGAVRARLAGRAGFLGATCGELDALPFADGELGAAFLVEVLEHLPRGAWGAVAAELARTVRPGGLAVLTTPNREDLDAKKVACPDCGAVFHRVQHVERVEAAALEALLVQYGFEPLLVRGLNFRHFPDRTLGRMVRLLFETLPALGGGIAPHLVAVGRRRPS
jgi:SAM-dependent methyltransferase